MIQKQRADECMEIIESLFDYRVDKAEYSKLKSLYESWVDLDRDNNFLRGQIDRLREALYGNGVHRDSRIVDDAIKCIEAVKNYEITNTEELLDFFIEEYVRWFFKQMIKRFFAERRGIEGEGHALWKMRILANGHGASKETKTPTAHSTAEKKP